MLVDVGTPLVEQVGTVVLVDVGPTFVELVEEVEFDVVIPPLV